MSKNETIKENIVGKKKQIKEDNLGESSSATITLEEVDSLLEGFFPELNFINETCYDLHNFTKLLFVREGLTTKEKVENYKLDDWLNFLDKYKKYEIYPYIENIIKDFYIDYFVHKIIISNKDLSQEQCDYMYDTCKMDLFYSFQTIYWFLEDWGK